MRRPGIGVFALLGLSLAVSLASCGRSGTKNPPDGAEAGQPERGQDSDPHSGGKPWQGNSAGFPTVDPGHPEGGTPSYNEGGFPPIVGGNPNEGEPCDPGALSCDGPSVRVCDHDGVGTTIAETCGLSETCSEGACVAIDCVPGERFCRAGQVVECNDAGTGADPIKTCQPNEYCVEQDGSALCHETACIAGEPMCLNQVATTCKVDGSGPKPGGESCSARGAVCHDGECVGQLCSPGEKLCQHDDVYVCTSDGAGVALFFDCDASEACDPELAACRPRLCEPGKLGCDDSRIAKCNALGLGWEQSGTDCSDSDQICVKGSCKTQTCVPSSTFCKSYDVYQCDEHGVTSSLYQDCDLNYNHCAPSYYANSAYCTSNSCTPGSAMCNGNLLSKCKEDGSGVEPGGSDCGDKICSNNACQTKVCTPGQYFCQNGDIAYCWDGVSYGWQQECGSNASCGNVGNGVECVPYACSPGDAACYGNQRGTCGDDGQSLSSVSEDCGAGGEVCSSTNACDSTAVDTLGKSEELLSASADTVVGNVIDVTSDRELTLLEANLVLAAARTMRWVVYERSGYYYESVYDKVVADQTGSGYLSSGPISYTLKAGHRYYIGVAVSGGGFVPYYDAEPFDPYLTFGRALGGLNAYYDTTIYAYGAGTFAYDMRFTTQAP